jgi:hypothetical protein
MLCVHSELFLSYEFFIYTANFRKVSVEVKVLNYKPEGHMFMTRLDLGSPNYSPRASPIRPAIVYFDYIVKFTM